MKAALFWLYLFSCLLCFTFLILSVYDFSNVSYRPANVMSRHEQNETNDDDVDEYEEGNGEPYYVVEEFWQFENQHKLNLEETEMVNLGDSECVKEVKISTYLNGTQKESLIHLLAEYSDVFFGKSVTCRGWVLTSYLISYLSTQNSSRWNKRLGNSNLNWV